MNSKIKNSGSKKPFLIIAPLVLMLTVYLALTPLVDKFELARGLLYGYLFYWGFWCIIFPLWAVGLEGFKKVFAPSAKI